jgi:hypothetical protein
MVCVIVLRQSEDHQMKSRNLAVVSLGAIAGCAMLAMSLSPAAAFTMQTPSIGKAVAASQIENVWYRRCWINAWGRRICRTWY